MEYQLRNWYYFTWLCGDHIVEQHVHNLDVAYWALGAHPVRAVGMGGRQVRTEPEYGQIYDHFAIDYEYPNGVHVLSMCRQIDGCENNVSETIVGTKGTFAQRRLPVHRRDQGARSGSATSVNPYVQEHIDLIESIRSGKPLNELKQVAESTLTAIMGRMSAYTGKAVTWEQALELEARHVPQAPGHAARCPSPPVARPGLDRADLIADRCTIDRGRSRPSGTRRPIAIRRQASADRRSPVATRRASPRISTRSRSHR